MAGMSVCRGCGNPIIWIRTAAGKAMPCDPERVPYWQSAAGPRRIVTADGEVVRAFIDGAPGEATGSGYSSHFATCPAAGRFRKGR